MTMEKLLARVKRIREERNRIFREEYCLKGQYTNTNGKITDAITCTVDANEYLSFMNAYDKREDQAIKKFFQHE